jgi:hypothetical protein
MISHCAFGFASIVLFQCIQNPLVMCQGSLATARDPPGPQNPFLERVSQRPKQSAHDPIPGTDRDGHMKLKVQSGEPLRGDVQGFTHFVYYVAQVVQLLRVGLPSTKCRQPGFHEHANFE